MRRRLAVWWALRVLRAEFPELVRHAEVRRALAASGRR